MVALRSLLPLGVSYPAQRGLAGCCASSRGFVPAAAPVSFRKSSPLLVLLATDTCVCDAECLVQRQTRLVQNSTHTTFEQFQLYLFMQCIKSQLKCYQHRTFSNLRASRQSQIPTPIGNTPGHCLSACDHSYVICACDHSYVIWLRSYFAAYWCSGHTFFPSSPVGQSFRPGEWRCWSVFVRPSTSEDLGSVLSTNIPVCRVFVSVIVLATSHAYCL